MKWTHSKGAQALPEEWDSLVGSNIFLKKNFLEHLESVNPCHQEYHLLYADGSLRACYADYTIKLDILTYSRFSFKLPVRVMGIPCSVSKQGFAFYKGYEDELLRHFEGEKGAKLILNSDMALSHPPAETLPACRMEIRWDTFSSYLASLRSHYRYRWQKAIKKWSDVTVEILEPSCFTKEMYTLYENVYNRSSFKLEKLSINFFQKLPLPAKLISARHNDTLLGFAVIVENTEELLFLFTGFDYSLVAHFDTYHNLLLEIVRYGISHKFQVIDFGQTAEDSKLKLGSNMHNKYLYVHHSNPVVNTIVRQVKGILSYKAPQHQYNVFK